MHINFTITSPSLSRSSNRFWNLDLPMKSSSSIWSKDPGLAKSFIDPMIPRYGETSSTTCLFDVKDAITGHGPIKRRQSIEEKMWPPPFEMVGNPGHCRTSTPSNIFMNDCRLELVSHQMQNQPISVAASTYASRPSMWCHKAGHVNKQTQSHIYNPVIISDSSEDEFEASSQLKVTCLV